MYNIWVGAPEVARLSVVAVIARLGGLSVEEATARFEARASAPVLGGLDAAAAQHAVHEFQRISGVEAVAQAG